MSSFVLLSHSHQGSQGNPKAHCDQGGGGGERNGRSRQPPKQKSLCLTSRNAYRSITWFLPKSMTPAAPNTSSVEHRFTYVASSIMSEKSMSTATADMAQLFKLAAQLEYESKDQIQNYRRHVLEPNDFLRELHQNWRLDASAPMVKMRARDFGVDPADLKYAVVSEAGFVSYAHVQASTSTDVSGAVPVPDGCQSQHWME